jgi:hypothetical protein
MPMVGVTVSFLGPSSSPEIWTDNIITESGENIVTESGELIKTEESIL